jgi:hypothetical protein
VIRRPSRPVRGLIVALAAGALARMPLNPARRFPSPRRPSRTPVSARQPIVAARV